MQMTSPTAIVLWCITAFVLWVRKLSLALLACALWAGAVVIMTADFAVNDHIFEASVHGCIGNPILSLPVVAAICIGLIVYTAPIQVWRK